MAERCAWAVESELQVGEAHIHPDHSGGVGRLFEDAERVASDPTRLVVAFEVQQRLHPERVEAGSPQRVFVDVGTGSGQLERAQRCVEPATDQRCLAASAEAYEREADFRRRYGLLVVGTFAVMLLVLLWIRLAPGGAERAS